MNRVFPDSFLVKSKKRFESKFKNNSSTSKLKKQFHSITQLLNTISTQEKNINFTFTRFLQFVRPDSFHFSYAPDVKNLSIDEMYLHIQESIQSGDSCAQVLCTLAKHRSHPIAKKLPEAYAKQQVSLLQQLDFDRLSSLTLRQREYLASIHQSEVMQDDLQKVFFEFSTKSLIHGDYRMPNILFRNKQKRAKLHIIDWELCGRGPRMYDWATLMVDYVTLYLCHYMEMRGKPEKLHLTDIEKLLQQHFTSLQTCFSDDPQLLAHEYLQWIGILLILKGLHVIPQYTAGEILSDLLFQMGRRFLLEYDQLRKKYFIECVTK